MKSILLIAMLLILSSTASAKIGTKDRSKTDLVVLHAIGGFACKDDKWTHFPSFKKLPAALAYLAKDDVVAGAHYVVAKDGKYELSTPEEKVASHVFGRKNKSDKLSYNQRSIGIEMLNDGDGKDQYPTEQIDAMVNLLKEIVKRYGLQRSAIKTHSELDRRKVECGGKKYSRRIDPGPSFPLSNVIERVFE